MVSEPQRCTAQSLPCSLFGAQLPLQATAWQTTDDWNRKGRGDKKQVHFLRWEMRKGETIYQRDWIGQWAWPEWNRLQSYSKTRGKKVSRCLIHHQQPCLEQGLHHMSSKRPCPPKVFYDRMTDLLPTRLPLLGTNTGAGRQSNLQ